MAEELTEQEKKVLENRYKQLDEIREVFADKKLLTRGEMEGKYTKFAEKYPHTWLGIMDDKITLGHLERNVEVYEHMYRKSKGRGYKERKFQTDMKFGEKLAEEYLYPTTGRPDTKNKNRALENARRQLNETLEIKEKSQLKKVDFD